MTVVLSPPPSKSIANRLLLLASLAQGTSRLRGARPLSGDVRVMIAALKKLGVQTEPVGERDLRVRGVGGRFANTRPVRLNLAGAGTAARFLAAASMLSPAGAVIDGDDRLRERPIDELLDALRDLGAKIEFLECAGRLPARITPPANILARTISVGVGRSSQFASALLLVGAFLPGGLTLRVPPAFGSAPYVEMTIALLRRAGVRVTRTRSGIRVAPTALPCFDALVEPDASSAGYLWAAAALTPGLRVRVPGLGRASTQGDMRLLTLLKAMGAGVRFTAGGVEVEGGTLRGLRADLRDIPDAAPTLAVLAACASSPSVLKGLGTLRYKESDRLTALARELGRAGVRCQASRDALKIWPVNEPFRGRGGWPRARVLLGTRNDHRLAMAFALLSLRRPGVTVENPACVAKSYPGFWKDFAILRSAAATHVPFPPL